MRHAHILPTIVALAAPAIPTRLGAQLSRTDSLGIVEAVTPAVHAWIGRKPPVIAQDAPSLLRAAAAWNALLQRALTERDSTLVAKTATPLTTRFNVVDATVVGDSVLLQVAATFCDGTRFHGATEEYVVVHVSPGWHVVASRFRGSGQGRCGS